MAARRKAQRPTSTLRKARSQATKAQALLIENVQQVWLAGMGAIARAQKDGPGAFQDAVAEGLKLLNRSRSQAEKIIRDAFETAQSEMQTRVETARDQASETWDNLEALFQSRVQRAMHQVGMPTAEEIRALTRRVAELNENVKRLEARAGTRRGAGPKRRSAPPGARRGSTRRTAATE